MFSPLVSTTKTGLTVIRVPLDSIESVTVIALANTGSRYETAGKEGIAHFFEHMVFKGTQQYPDAAAISIAVDSVGANCNAFTSKEYTGYYVKAAAEHLPLALDVVSDMLLTPKLRQEDIDREKGVIIEELNMYVDNPQWHIGNIFERLVYADAGLAHDIVGTKESIQSFTAEDFHAFLQQWYGLENLVLVVAGAKDSVASDATLQLIEKAFSKKPAEQRGEKVSVEPILPALSVSERHLHVESRKTQQAHFVLGWPGLSRKDPLRYALGLYGVIMGGNMSSRLFSEIREKRGLCYYIHASSDNYHNTGFLEVSAGVDSERVDEAVTMTLKLFQESILTNKPSAAELRRAKDYLLGKLVLGFEDSESLAQHVGLRQLLHGKVETLDELRAHIEDVTLEQVHATAQKCLAGVKPRLAIIGPFKDQVERFEQLLAVAETE